jgi:hypothetical protein
VAFESGMRRGHQHSWPRREDDDVQGTARECGTRLGGGRRSMGTTRSYYSSRWRGARPRRQAGYRSDRRRAWRRGCPRHARWSGSRRSCSHGRRRARAGGQRGNKHDGRRPRSGSCSWHGGWSGSRERRMRSRHPAAAGSAMLSDIPAERWTSFQLPVPTRQGAAEPGQTGPVERSPGPTGLADRGS